MDWSPLQQKLYRKNLVVYQKIHNDKTKKLAQKIRKELHIGDTYYLLQYNPLERIKCFKILLNGGIEKAFYRFWNQVMLDNVQVLYRLNTPELRYFMAELFFCDCVTEEILKLSNLSGIEWIDYNQDKNDNCIYLKISPGIETEAVKNFLSLPQYSIRKMLAEKRNLPHYIPQLGLKNDALKDDILLTNELYHENSIESLETICQAINPQEYQKFNKRNGDEKKMTKLWLVRFLLIHSHNKKSKSLKTLEGYILKKAEYTKQKRKLPFSVHLS